MANRIEKPKAKPNRGNVVKNLKRIKKNDEILRRLKQ
jgi:hypothetical protein